MHMLQRNSLAKFEKVRGMDVFIDHSSKFTIMDRDGVEFIKYVQVSD